MQNVFSAADILLPDFDACDARLWATIACDQFTSEPAYWEEVEREVGDAPSTLRMILPEVYLGEGDGERIAAQHLAMKKYRESVLRSHPDSMIYVERVTSDGRVRNGLVGKIDLEAYDYRQGATSPVRATEGTVLSRIPPRVRVRRGASLETPHVMLLINDPDDRLFSRLKENAWAMPLAYDTPLLLGGGRLTGRFLSRAQQKDALDVLSLLAPHEAGGILFAVGDGNHSLASARAYYEELKEQMGDAALRHPARYALAEIVNIHDEALDFEPIFRTVKGVSPVAFLDALPKSEEGHTFTAVFAEGGVTYTRTVTMPATHSLAVGTLQRYLDEYLAAHPDVEVDYIHDEGSLRALSAEEGVVGFLFDGMKKEELFSSVERDGALPRKTFSMGAARDKRYYMECRAIQ